MSSQGPSPREKHFKKSKSKKKITFAAPSKSAMGTHE